LPEIDDVTRREFLIAAAGLLVLAPHGCGSGAGSGPSSETRTVEHAFGATEVPARPERVAALQVTVASALVSVGLRPVASVENTAAFVEPLRGLLDPGMDLSEIEDLGSTSEFSLERLAALEPDLIIGNTLNGLDRSGYERLAEISPAVVFDFPGTERWREHFEEVTGAAGRSKEAGEVVRRYEDALARAREKVGGDPEVSFVRVFGGGGSFIMDTPRSFAGEVATGMGLTVTEGPRGVGERPNEAIFEVSLERLDLVTGDLIVVPAAWADEEGSLEVLSDQPLWRRLPAVQAGRVIEVHLGVYNGGTYAAGRLLAEILTDALS